MIRIALLAALLLTPGWALAADPSPTPPAVPPAPIADRAAPAVTQGFISCPMQLKAMVAIDGSDSKNWAVGGLYNVAPLKGARLYTGPVSEKTMERYNELTPIPSMNRERDEFQQIWSFDDPGLTREGILLVCDYAGSDNFLMRAVPAGAKKCTESTMITKRDGVPPTQVSCE